MTQTDGDKKRQDQDEEISSEELDKVARGVTEQNADVARQWAIIGDDVMEMMNDTGTPDVPKKP